MVLDVKKFLKRSDFLVNFSRFLQSMPSAWQSILEERQDATSKMALVNQRQKVIEAYQASQSTHMLQIGTGENHLAGWLNTDLEPMSGEVIFLNALEKFPFEDGKFDYVFSEHMIEHIPYKGGLFMLQECFRVMKAGGKIRIATPDVERIIGLFATPKSAEQIKYIEWSATYSLGLYNQEKTKLQQRRTEWDIDYGHIQRQYPDITRDPVCFIVNNFFRSYGHQFLYDQISLQGILLEAGFEDVCRFAPLESDVEELQNIESHGRLIGDEFNRYETIVLQATKPL